MTALVVEGAYLDRLDNIERKKHTQKIKIIKHLYVEGPKANSDLCNHVSISTPTSASLPNELSDQDLDSIEPQSVIGAVSRGDRYAINILAQIGMGLGKGISIPIQLFNPELIILGGKVAEAKQYTNSYCMPQLRDKTKIALPNPGQGAAILGFVATVVENAFEDRFELN